jgi:dienelactone hydrolase
MRSDIIRLTMALLVLGAFSISAFAQVPSTGLPGTQLVGERDITFTDNSLNSPTVDARVWYPAVSAGTNTGVANGQFPVIAFGHGFNLNYLNYTDICSHLASWGYIVVSPDVQNGFNVDHQEFARELGACLNFLLSEGGNSGSDFFQKTDTMTGVLGHSMGGGASCLVPGVYPSIDAVGGLASAETNPSAITGIGTYSGPYQVISGSSDNTSPESSNQVPMYNAAQGLKQWVSITGGAHCKFTDGATICDLVSNPGSVSRDFQRYLAKKYTTAFFNYFLKNDMDAKPFICGDSVQAEINAGNVTNQTNVSCAVGVDAPLTDELLVYPNPGDNVVRISSPGTIRVFDLQGREHSVRTSLQGNEQEIDLRTLPVGNYLIHLQDEHGLRVARFLRHR